jgi:predicted transcriptional regulator
MDNPVRARVHSMVAQAPGLSLSEVQARAGIAWGTAVHHLRRLEANGLVVSVSERAHRRYFLVDTPAAAQRSAVSVVIHPTARRIAHLVSQRPGIDQSSICVTLGLNNPAVSKHLHQFQERGLVLSQRSGRSRHYHPTGALGAALVLLEPAQATQTTQATQATMVGTSHTPELQARVMA